MCLHGGPHKSFILHCILGTSSAQTIRYISYTHSASACIVIIQLTLVWLRARHQHRQFTWHARTALAPIPGRHLCSRCAPFDFERGFWLSRKGARTECECECAVCARVVSQGREHRRVWRCEHASVCLWYTTYNRSRHIRQRRNRTTSRKAPSVRARVCVHQYIMRASYASASACAWLGCFKHNAHTGHALYSSMRACKSSRIGPNGVRVRFSGYVCAGVCVCAYVGIRLGNFGRRTQTEWTSAVAVVAAVVLHAIRRQCSRVRRELKPRASV